MDAKIKEVEIYNKRKSQFCCAVQGGHAIARDVATQMGLTQSRVFTLAASLQAEGLITREYKYIDGSHHAHAIFGLTELGREIARQPIVQCAEGRMEFINDNHAAFCHAIAQGYTTNDQLMGALNVSRNWICQMGLLLDRRGLIIRVMACPERNYDTALTHSAGRTYATYSLTESGMALAAKALPTHTAKQKAGAPSIRDLCNGPDYRQWLRGMKQLARSN